jgi:5-methylcytosine-specific restriction endonuclease McrA
MLDRQLAERAASRPKCVQCGATLKMSNAEYCSASECQRIGNAARERARYAANAEARRQRIYAARVAWTPEQIESAKKVARLRRLVVGYSESKRAVDARRRARKSGAVVEKFTNGEIFDRDGWRCGICGKRINRKLVYPHPLSVSLDHVIPLSLGDEHSRANVRAAHLTCNVQRGAAREGADQLALL